MKIVHEHLKLDPSRRIIAIGDIHGGKALLEALLTKIGFSAADELFLLGDYTERGPECLATINYIEDLTQRPNVHALQGNNDTVWWFLEDSTPAELFKNYIETHPFSVFREAAQAKGFNWQEADAKELKAYYRATIGHEMTFLKSLPHIIETEHLLFIHAGIDDLAKEDETLPIEVMKNDGFLDKRIPFKKRLIVGHFPTKIYRHFCECANPIIDRTLNIISIDGGYACSYGGQLNALLLQGESDPRPKFTFVDDLPVVIACRDHDEAYKPVRTLVYDRDAFTITKAGEHETLVSLTKDSMKCRVPSALIYEKASQYYCYDTSTERLSFRKGEALSLVHSVGSEFIMKKHGISGWVKKSDLGITFPFARKGTMQDATELERLRGVSRLIQIPDASPFYEDGLKGRLYVLEGADRILGSASIEGDVIKRVHLLKEADTIENRALLLARMQADYPQIHSLELEDKQ